MTAVRSETETLDIGIDGECPVCAQNPAFNAKAIAAAEEARAIMRGEIPTKWYTSLDEARKDLNI